MFQLCACHSDIPQYNSSETFRNVQLLLSHVCLCAVRFDGYFFRIPKLLLTDERFAEVSTDAKLLYGLLLDRMELSYRNGWIDEQNRVFIIFTAEEVMSTLHCRSEKAARLFAELDSSKGIGLIERKRQGLGRPTLIYVKDFSGA